MASASPHPFHERLLREPSGTLVGMRTGGSSQCNLTGAYLDPTGLYKMGARY
ncbi:hypothetical protein ACIP10_26000 [Streptomyces galbus]|uniref:hypothetical protein n=1 Tax=Streptomyces galbus TaxID=33898 RepID=UPI00379C796F